MWFNIGCMECSRRSLLEVQGMAKLILKRIVGPALQHTGFANVVLCFQAMPRLQPSRCQTRAKTHAAEEASTEHVHRPEEEI